MSKVVEVFKERDLYPKDEHCELKSSKSGNVSVRQVTYSEVLIEWDFVSEELE
ncbi:hypothetical protein AB4Z17_26430 [Paenibacillus sp. TAF43_2]|uniref:hypothetical protein n=1 Tax=Paenibacillus sp. TAF43_2 TaxID=3233069 RepID=UPI003F9969AB